VLKCWRDTKSVGFEEVRNKLIIDLFYTTGIRTELIHLKISDIDASKFSIKVGKRNKERILPVLPIISSFLCI
jgi:integrase/recombinase XerC